MLKFITMIDPVTRYSELTQYSNKKAMTIANLVETVWLVRYQWPVESRMTKEENSSVTSVKIA